VSKHILVHGNDRLGYQNEQAVCDHHLAEVLRKSPLREHESVLDADDDIECEYCASDRRQEEDSREFVAMAAVGPTVDIAVYEQAVKGRREFRSAYREARAEAKRLREAADKVLQLWVEMNSQEMYGEHLREGLDPEHYDAWETAHDALREAVARGGK
jgi:hypothetical protein